MERDFFVFEKTFNIWAMKNYLIFRSNLILVIG
jgi:hypothetical protein